MAPRKSSGVSQHPTRRSQRSSRSGTSTSSSSPSHATPIACPTPGCTLPFIHQHPPSLQYYEGAQPATYRAVNRLIGAAGPNSQSTPPIQCASAQLDDEDAESDWPFTDADLNGRDPTTREANTPVRDIQIDDRDPQTPINRNGHVAENGLITSPKPFNHQISPPEFLIPAPEPQFGDWLTGHEPAGPVDIAREILDASPVHAEEEKNDCEHVHGEGFLVDMDLDPDMPTNAIRERVSEYMAQFPDPRDEAFEAVFGVRRFTR